MTADEPQSQEPVAETPTSEADKLNPMPTLGRSRSVEQNR